MNQSTATNSSNTQKPQSVKTNELPLSCPTKENETWNLHPKVYLEFNDKGEASCQYCGSKYILDNK